MSAELKDIHVMTKNGHAMVDRLLLHLRDARPDDEVLRRLHEAFQVGTVRATVTQTYHDYICQRVSEREEAFS